MIPAVTGTLITGRNRLNMQVLFLLHCSGDRLYCKIKLVKQPEITAMFKYDEGTE